MRRRRMFTYINIYKHSFDMLYMLIILCVDSNVYIIYIYKHSIAMLYMLIILCVDVECLYILIYINIH